MLTNYESTRRYGESRAFLDLCFGCASISINDMPSNSTNVGVPPSVEYVDDEDEADEVETLYDHSTNENHL